LSEPEAAFRLSPVRLMATHELVLEQIETAINLGRFRPGDRLPSERDLADMLHVSRTTVREAIAVLEARGVVEVRRGRTGGLIVREVHLSPPELRRLLRANRDQLRDIFDYRVAVESAAAGLAAERRTAQDLRLMRKLSATLNALVDTHDSEQAAATFAQFQDVDSQFHLVIARAARSSRLARSILKARAAMFLPVGAVFAGLEPTANELHEQIVEAIEAKDAELASTLMAEHINGTRATVEAWL